MSNNRKMGYITAVAAAFLSVILVVFLPYVVGEQSGNIKLVSVLKGDSGTSMQYAAQAFIVFILVTLISGVLGFMKLNVKFLNKDKKKLLLAFVAVCLAAVANIAVLFFGYKYYSTSIYAQEIKVGMGAILGLLVSFASVVILYVVTFIKNAE